MLSPPLPTTLGSSKCGRKLQPNRPEVDPPTTMENHLKPLYSNASLKTQLKLTFLKQTQTVEWAHVILKHLISCHLRVRPHFTWITASLEEKRERYTLWILIYWTLGPPPRSDLGDPMSTLHYIDITIKGKTDTHFYIKIKGKIDTLNRNDNSPQSRCSSRCNRDNPTPTIHKATLVEKNWPPILPHSLSIEQPWFIMVKYVISLHLLGVF